MVWIFLGSQYLFLFYQEKPVSSCSIFKLHPGTFSFSIISDIFQAIFINSNSYRINWENAKIHVSYRSQEQSLSFFSPVERQMWSPGSFYHHLNGFLSIPSDGEQGSMHHLYFNVLFPFLSVWARFNFFILFKSCFIWCDSLVFEYNTRDIPFWWDK